MNLIADLHCHTVASGHAYSTIQELVQEAKKKGIRVIALTDHGIKAPGAPHIYYFGNLKIVPEIIDGVKILKGVEANIMDFEGNVDMPEMFLKSLDIVIASLHDGCISPGCVKENTEACIKALKNPYVDILGHPDNPMYPIDVDEVAAAARDYGKMIEMNNSSYLVRAGSEEYALKVALAAKKYGTKLACGSDAHISFSLGEFGAVKEIIKKADVPEELIINTDIDKIMDYIDNKRERIGNSR